MQRALHEVRRSGGQVCNEVEAIEPYEALPR